MATITDHTASVVHGTGAGITHLGFRSASLLGDTGHGMTDGISAAGTTHIITEDTTEAGTTHGTGEAAGAGMTLGTVRSTALITVHTIADGTADGTHIGVITTITVTSPHALRTTGRYGTAQDIRLPRKGYSAAQHLSEEALEQAAG